MKLPKALLGAILVGVTFVTYNKKQNKEDLPEWTDFQIIRGPLWNKKDPIIKFIKYYLQVPE